MTAAGFLFFGSGLIITGYISLKRLLGSKILPFSLYFYHLLFAIYYWHYSLTNPADAKGYYKSLDYTNTFGTGSQFIKWSLQQLHNIFQGSYLDYYFLFQLFGFLGFCFFYKVLDESLFFRKTQRTRILQVLVLFFPNMHFWTVAIGKDSLIFLSITMIIWGAIKYHERFAIIALGFALTYFIRPHIAGIFLGAALLAMLWGPGIPLRWRIVGNLVVVAAILYVLPLIQKFVGLEEMSVQSVTHYLEQRQRYNLEGGSSVDIRGYPLPLKVFTFLFRPLFFDAKNINGFIVSLENVAYIWLFFLFFSRHSFPLLWKYRFSFFMRFNFFAFLAGTYILAESVANTGIAIRQKTMFMPNFLILTVTLYAIRQYYAAGVDAVAHRPGPAFLPETRDAARMPDMT